MKKYENIKILLVLGDKEYQKEIITAIIHEIADNQDVKNNIEVFPPNKQDWNKIFEQLKTYSLFGTPRFFIVEETNLFTGEKNAKDILNLAIESYNLGDFEKSFNYLISALQSIDINESDYKNLKDNPSNIKKFFEDIIENADFCVEVLKRFELPEKLPEKSMLLDFDGLNKNIPNGHYLIITASNFDKRKKIFKDLQKLAKVFEQTIFKKDSIQNKRNIDATIKDFLTKNNKKISQEDLYLLQELAYESSDFEKNLEKLLLLTYDIDIITSEHISIAFDNLIFADSKLLSQYIKERNFEKIISIISNPTQSKQDFIKLAGYIRSMLRNGIILLEIFENKNIKDYNSFVAFLNQEKHNLISEGSSFFDQHPYYLFQCYQTFGSYDIKHLKEMYIKLFEIDRDFKSTQKKPVDLLIDFFTLLFNPRK